MRLAWLIIVCVLLTGCGSGSKDGSGSSSGTDDDVPIPVQVPVTARIKIGTKGPTAETVLYAAQFTLRLPLDVSLPADPAEGMLPDDVLQQAPSGSYAGASYQPATLDAGASLRVNIYHHGGFTVGPLVSLNCIFAPGAAVSVGGFTLDGFSAYDSDGAAIPGITAQVTY